MNKEKQALLNSPLPDWAITKHPSRSYLSVIHPMAVIDRLNEAFGVGGWHYSTEAVRHEGKFAVVKGVFDVPSEDIHLEQFGGNDNADTGDAYKGASTDALTKIASYLGVGASIYKDQGNVAPKPETTLTDALALIGGVFTIEELTEQYKKLPKWLRDDEEVIAKCKEIKEGLQEITQG